MKLLLALLVAASTTALWWARHHLVRVNVAGESMHPTLEHGDVVLALRTTGRGLRPGRVVVAGRLSAPSGAPSDAPDRGAGPGWIVKRIAALRLDDGPALGDHDAAQDLAPGTVYLLGDNQRASYDSRAVGPWPADRLLGVVVYRLRRAADARQAAQVPARR